MKMYRAFIAVMAASLAVAGALYAQPDDRGGMRGPGRGEGRGCEDGRGMGPGEGRGMGPHHFFGDPARMKEDLGLTDEQVSRISAINLEHKKQMLAMREQIEPKRAQLQKLLLDENVDLGQVRQTLKEIADLQVEVRMLRIKHRIEIEKVLTAEQRAKLRAERDSMRMRHGPPEPEDN
jgi:Spy/CpxP family protein refolding chaperone